MPEMPASTPAQDSAAAPAGAPGDPPKKKSKKTKQPEKKEERALVFRNYVPRTPELKDSCLPRVTSAEIEDTIDREIESILAAAEEQDAVLAIAPRKPNWDLKRDADRKMQVLQARTDRAVVQLIRRRIRQGAGAPPEAANPEDERGQRDEASLALAREVARAEPARAGAESDDEAA